MCASLGITMLAILDRLKIIELKKIIIFEMLAFIFSMGFLLFTIYMFIIGFIGIKYSSNIFIPLYLNSVYAIFYVINMVKNKKYMSVKHYKTNMSTMEKYINIVLTIIIILIFISFLVKALSSFLVYPDEFSHWGLQAKNIFIGKKMNTFTPTGIESYPNFLPLLYSGYYFLTSSINENMIKIFSTIFCVLTYFNCMAICFRRNLNKTYFSALFLVFLMGYATIVQISSSTYADIPFMCFYSTGVIYLLEYLLTGNKNFMVISIFNVIGSTWVKTDGLYLLMYTLLFIIFARILFKKLDFSKTKWSDVLKYILFAISLILAWRIYIIIFHFPAGVGAGIEIRPDYFIAMSMAMRNQFFENPASSLYIILIMFSFLFLYNRLEKRDKTFVFSIMSFVIINIAFLALCYLVKFGAEGPIAASFIRYISRVMPLLMICILEFFKEKKVVIGESRDEK
jgi:hypothetical protein